MLKVIKYSATWCGPCNVIKPLFNELKEENKDIVFEFNDVDEKNEHGVRSVPTVIYEVDGEEKERLIGVRSKSLYQDRINFHK